MSILLISPKQLKKIDALSRIHPYMKQNQKEMLLSFFVSANAAVSFCSFST